MPFPRISALLLAPLFAAACATGSPAATSSTTPQATATTAGTTNVRILGDFDVAADRLRADPVADAFDRLRSGQPAGVREALEALVAQTPAGWSPITTVGGRLRVAAWSFGELPALTLAHPEATEIEWVAPSYARAYYLLGYLAVEEQDFARAVAMLDAGLALDAHPVLLSERGVVAQQLHDFEGALGFFRRIDADPRATDADRARALRGRGGVLIDLGRLDEAQAAFEQSLTIEDSEIARNELQYIEGLRDHSLQPVDSEVVNSRTKR